MSAPDPAGEFAVVLTGSGAGAALAGDIVNAPALKHELGLAADASPAALLRACAARWPEAPFAPLDGVFVAALEHRGQVLLHRDASGLHNLFWQRAADGGIACASHLPRLFALPGTTRRIARRSLHEYLRLLEIAAPNTVFDGVAAVEAGRTWRVGTSDLHALPAAPQAPWQGSFGDAVGGFDALLRAAVERRLDDAERPAVFLSGGIDSALIAAMAAAARPDTVAYTVGFDGAPYDESARAARIAASFGLRHRVLRFAREALLDALSRYAAQAEQPLADPAILATLLSFEQVRGDHDVVLDGTGADESIGAMPARHVRLAVAWGALLPPPLRRLTVRLLRAAGATGWTPLVDFEHPAETMMRWHGFTRPEIEALCGEPVSLAHTRFMRTFERHPRHAHFARYSDLVDAMTCERLNQSLLISGAPVRFPFADAATDRFLRALPVEFRHRAGEPKRIARALLARYAAPALWTVPKHGFDFPLHDFLADDDFALVRRHLLGGGVALGWAAVAQRFVGGERSLAFRVWALVVLQQWLRAQGLAA